MLSRFKKGSLKYILINIILAATISILIFLYLFSPYKVIGDSMFPILKSGEKVLISNQILTGIIKRFDIVVIEPPGMNGKRLIKRVIGLPGESIHIKSGDVFINNLLVKEPFLKNKGDVMFRSINMKKKVIPPDSYFLMGDHREKSTDSRNFGPLHRKNILGKTIFRYWPITKLGIVN